MFLQEKVGKSSAFITPSSLASKVLAPVTSMLGVINNAPAIAGAAIDVPSQDSNLP
jgi:hypothetical protein